MWIAVSITVVVVFIAGVLVGILLFYSITKYRSQNSKPKPSSHQPQQTGPQYEEVAEIEESRGGYRPTQRFEMKTNEAYWTMQHWFATTDTRVHKTASNLYNYSYCNPLLPLLPLIPPVRVSGITTISILVPESQHHFSLVIYSTIIAVHHSLLSSTYGCWCFSTEYVRWLF